MNYEEMDYIKVEFFTLDENTLGKELVQELNERQPFTNLEDIEKVFSALSYIDHMQNKKNIGLGKVENKPLNFKIQIKGKNDKDINEYTFTNINIGEGHFTQGLEHFLSLGQAKKEETLLKRFRKNLLIPNKLSLEELGDYEQSVLKSIKSIADSRILGEELSAFLDAFSKNAFSEDKQKNKQKKDLTQKQLDIVAKVKNFSSEKKIEKKEYMLSNTLNLFR